MLDVRTMTQWRKSTSRPWRSVRRPSSKTCRKMSQHRLCGLLELVEQDHRERVLADSRDQPPTVPVDDGVAEQAVERLRRLVLAHVEPDQPVRRPEEVFRERLRDLGFPGARRPTNRKTPKAGSDR